MDKINVCIACDDNYAKYAGVLIASVLSNAASNDNLAVYILDGGISEERKAEILTLKNIKDCEIILGVRPEHMVLSFEQKPGCIPVTLEVNEMMGSELHLHLDTEDGTRLILRVPTINLSAKQRAELVFGAKLYVSFEGKVMHFFDPETTFNMIKDNISTVTKDHEKPQEAE